MRSQIIRKPENSEVTQTPGERCGRAGVRGNSQRELWSLAPEQTPWPQSEEIKIISDFTEVLFQEL